MTETARPTPSRSPPPRVPTTMRATTYDRYGNPEDVLRVTEVPVPEIGPADVLVEVRSASVNALDWHFTTGLPMFARPALGLRRPHRTIPGADVAGVVVAVGADVTRHRVGDEVFGEVSGGGFAEYVAAPADWMVAKPANLGFEEASTIGVAAETALQGLRDWGRLEEGPARAGQRRVRRRRHVRRPAGQGARRRPRHGGVQHPQRRDRRAHRRRPGRRLHPRGRHRHDASATT